MYLQIFWGDTLYMKIVITARDFATHDDKAIKMLKDAGHEVVDYSGKYCGNSTDEETVASLLGDADIVVMGLEPFGKTVSKLCPNIKMISKRSIGYDSVDLKECEKRGITVARTTGMVEGAVAEHVMAYIMYFARELSRQNSSMHKGEWDRVMTYGAKNRTLGLVGFGGIGKEIAKRAVPFGMNVIYYCRHPKKEWEEEYGVKYASFEELISQSDYISVNVNLSDSTKGMFGEDEFSKMKKECVFINIARSPIMDVNALKNALDKGIIRGAGIDVFDSEPCTDSPLKECENAVLTPHTAPYTFENFSAMNCCAAQNVLDYLKGELKEKFKLI